MTDNEIFERALKAKSDIKLLSEKQKNHAIEIMAKALEDNTDIILKENEEDIKAANGKISDVMIDRLSITAERIKNMASGMKEVCCLPDPNNKVLNEITRPNGLSISKISVPMGVIGIIYESRPNVTSDAAVLCFKSSNVCILRSGKEAYRTSKAIVNALRSGLKKCWRRRNPEPKASAARSANAAC